MNQDNLHHDVDAMNFKILSYTIEEEERKRNDTLTPLLMQHPELLMVIQDAEKVAKELFGPEAGFSYNVDREFDELVMTIHTENMPLQETLALERKFATQYAFDARFKSGGKFNWEIK